MLDVSSDLLVALLVLLQDFTHDEALLILAMLEHAGPFVQLLLRVLELVEEETVAPAYVQQLYAGVVAGVDLLADLVQEGLV